MAKDRNERGSRSYSGLNIRETARSRPVAAAAVATAAAAAGAYLWSRRSEPLMKWGREDSGEEAQDRSLETVGASGSTNTPTSARSGRGGSRSGKASGLDQTSKSQSKTGAISY